MIKGKFSPSLQPTAKANNVYSFAKSSSEYDVAKAVIKYSLASAYSYLDEKGLNKIYKEVVRQLDNISIQSSFNRQFSDNQTIDSQSVIEAAKVLSDVYSGITDHVEIQKTFGRIFEETQLQSDFINYINTIKSIADTALPVDSLNRTVTYNRTFADTVSVPDRIIAIFFGDVEIDGVIVDPFGIDDDPEIAINKPFTDNYSGTVDRYSSQFTTSRYEFVNSPDAFSRVLSYIRSYSESITPSENFNKVVDFNRTYNESITNSETTTKDIETLYTENVENIDNQFVDTELNKEEYQDQFDENIIDYEKVNDDIINQIEDHIMDFDALKSDEQNQEDATTFDQSLVKEDITDPQDIKYIDFSKHLIFNPYSYYFSGVTSDYVQYTMNSSIVPYGTGDFTVECWIYPTKDSSSGIYSTSANSGYGFEISWLGAGNQFIRVTGDNGNTFQMDSTNGDAPANTWTHVAVTRETNTIRVFVNGTLKNTKTYSGSFSYGPSDTLTYIGRGVASFYGGRISNLRVVIGTALYNSTFVPSAVQLTNIPGTELLTCQDNGFFDNSYNNLLIQPINNVQTSTLSPFLPIHRAEPLDASQFDVTLAKSDNQQQNDQINYVNDFYRDYTDIIVSEESADLDISTYLEAESVILSDIVTIIYYVGRVFNDDQYMDDVFARIINFIRIYEDFVVVEETKSIDFVQGNQYDFAVPTETSSLQYYKYPNETQTQQDAGSLISSDYVTNYGDYFSEYYVGEVRTF